MATKKASDKKLKELRKKLTAKPKKNDNQLKPSDQLSTGCTLLNLACTGSVQGGLAKGKYHFFVGDSESGKTFLTLTCFAEACRNPEFKNHRLIFDNAEDGALMDWEEYFGKSAANRIEAPSEDEDGQPRHSETIEDFYDHLDDAVDAGRPFIYVLDSMDALSSSDEEKKAQEQRKARKSGKDTAGSYGDGKAKKNSANLRRFIKYLRSSGSILIIINQTRDNLGFGFETKTRSGGKALKFYAALEIWTSVAQKLKKPVGSKKMSIGIVAQVEVKKNRFNGRKHVVKVPIYHSTGIDDVGACIDWLLEWKHWKLAGASIKVPEFDFKGTKAKLIKFIESNNLEDDLQDIVGTVWKGIEDQLKVKRKKKYE